MRAGESSSAGGRAPGEGRVPRRAARRREPCPPVAYFATQGRQHLDAQRTRELLERLDAQELPFERAHRLRSALALLRTLRASPPELVVMEGTGVAGGLVLLALNLRGGGVRFVVGSGDAVGPYLALRSRALGVLGGAYQRLLCRRCAGYIGWTPYLAGRALTLGAPRAISAPGWPRGRSSEGARERVRAQLGIDADALVVGIVGSLNWRARVRYAYGAELVGAVHRSARADLVAHRRRRLRLRAPARAPPAQS